MRVWCAVLLSVCVLLVAHVGALRDPYRPDVLHKDEIFHECIHGKLKKHYVEVKQVHGREEQRAAARKLQQTPTPAPTAAPGPIGHLRMALVQDMLYPNKGRPYACFDAGETYLRGSATLSSPPCATNTSTNCVATCTQDDIFTAEKFDLLERLLIAARAYFELTLSVRQLTAPMSVSQNCRVDNMLGQFNASEVQNGYPGVDMVLFVTAAPTVGNTLAWAAACQFEETYFDPNTGRAVNGRPTVGLLNFGTNQLDLREGAFFRQLGTAIHEITHALGFTQTTLDALGMIRDLPAAAYNDVVTRKFVTTARVKEMVNKHFGCSSGVIPGGELESGGGAGTEFSHWEKRLFMNEYMTGAANKNIDPVFSNLTLALLEDTGWYYPNYTQGELLEWGNNLGCDFVEKACNMSGWRPGGVANNAYWCTLTGTTAQQQCIWNGGARGTCDNTAIYSANLPAQYEYFPTNPAKGGKDALADYCPYIMPYSNGDCLDASYYDAQDQSYGDQACPTCRCFTARTTSSITSPEKPVSACFKTNCVYRGSANTPTLLVFVADEWYECPSAGGPLTTIATTVFVSFTCPKASDYCTPRLARAARPVIESLVPDEGPFTGEHTLTLLGKNFLKYGASTVLVDNVAATDVVVASNGTMISLTTPHIAGDSLPPTKAASIQVQDSFSTSVSLASSYTLVRDWPSIVSLVPDLGPTYAGFFVTINGQFWPSDTEMVVQVVVDRQTSVFENKPLTVKSATVVEQLNNTVVVAMPEMKHLFDLPAKVIVYTGGAKNRTAIKSNAYTFSPNGVEVLLNFLAVYWWVIPLVSIIVLFVICYFANRHLLRRLSPKAPSVLGAGGEYL